MGVVLLRAATVGATVLRRAAHPRAFSAAAPPPPPLPPAEARVWTDAEVRRALSERSMMLREVEGSSFRRLMYLTGAFLLIKYAKVKLQGARE